jgi:hypothetical protein
MNFGKFEIGIDLCLDRDEIVFAREQFDELTQVAVHDGRENTLTANEVERKGERH